jgi:hypothetical protein
VSKRTFSREEIVEEFIEVMAAYDTYQQGYLSREHWKQCLHKAGGYVDALIEYDGKASEDFRFEEYKEQLLKGRPYIAVDNTEK